MSGIIAKLRESYEGETWESVRSFEDDYELESYVADKEGIGAIVKVLRISRMEIA